MRCLKEDQNNMEPNNDNVEVIEADGDDELYFVGDENEEEDDAMNSDSNEEDGADLGPVSDDSDLTFSKHKKAVLCIAIDPKSSDLAVSGGEDDTAFVWNVNTGDVLFECTGHTDSVICASFSFDGVYVAVGDMKGLIKVWKVATKTAVWTTETTDLLWMDWHHRSHVLLAGTIDGMVWMWRIPSGELKTFPGRRLRSDAGTVTPDGTRAVVGYESGDLKILDLKKGTVLYHITIGTHKDTITSLDCHPENTLVISGSVDRSAKLINSQKGEIVATLPVESSASNDSCSVEAVGFCHCMHHVATGTVNGLLDIWDVPTQAKRYSYKHEAGITRLLWEPQSQLLYTGNLDGVVRLWDTRTSGGPAVEWFGHSSEILDMSLSRRNNKLISCSADETCKIFNRRKDPKNKFVFE